MRKYDLKKIMKQAHRTYKYVGQKKGQTFGEVLKATWRLEKMRVTMAENEAKRKAERAKELEEFKNRKPAISSSYNDLSITWNDCYSVNSRGSMGAQYCGD